MISERRTVYEMLYDVFEKEGFSNLVLKEYESTGFVSAMFYGTIQRSVTIDFILGNVCKADVTKMDPVTRTIMRMGAWQILFSDKVPPFASVSTSVDLCKELRPQSASFVNAILRKLIRENPSVDTFRPDIRVSLKSEIFGILKKSYGRERAVLIGEALLKRPGICIRPNTLKTDRESLKKILISEGVKVKDSDLVQGALKIEGTDISSLQSFRDGLFFVQNEAAQIASIIADPQEGTDILDCCAAPGGKSTHMAELTDDKARILSLDINESRLDLIKDNYRRLGISSVDTMCADSTDLRSALGQMRFDLVLCDVPCSGLGLMARKPDIRLTISYDRISELLPRQRLILQNASAYVRPGGVLCYCTCTLNRAENEETIQEFLKDHADFVASDITCNLPSTLIMDENREKDAHNGMLTLYPDIDGCDGFFICRLERRAI